MKKLYHYFTLAVFVMLIASCSKKDDEPVFLNVSPSAMELLSEKGSSVSFFINTGTDTQWVISSYPEWLSLSASSGKGSGSITMTALSTNESSQSRSAQISVLAGGINASVEVTQRGAFLPNCQVGFSDLVILNNSAAFKYEIDPNVSYFYAGYLDVKAAGWTDQKIVEALMDEGRFDPMSSETTGLQGYGGMSSNTEYYLCAIGFNAKGERGDLTKMKIKTMSVPSHYPFIGISDARYNSSTWYWTTTPDAYTSKYYMIFSSGINGWALSVLFCDAEIAWLIKDGIAKGNFEPIARGGEWQGTRNTGDSGFFVATWGLDTDSQFSPVLNSGYWEISQNKVSKMPVSEKGKYHRGTPDAKIAEIQSQIQIARMK